MGRNPITVGAEIENFLLIRGRTGHPRSSLFPAVDAKLERSATRDVCGNSSSFLNLRLLSLPKTLSARSDGEVRLAQH